MGTKEGNRRWYLKYKERIIAKQNAYNNAHKEYINKKTLEYYYAHREERLAYYQKNKDRINAVNGEHRRNTVITYADRPNILKVAKSPYPENKKCMYCHKPAKVLFWHHWDDDKPGDGIWLCPSCHRILHILLKRGFNRKNIVTNIKNLFIKN